MNKIITLLFLATLTLFAMAKKQQLHSSGVDDWDYNASTQIRDKFPRGGLVSTMASSAPMMMKKSLGFSVGGAKDADNFYENIKNSYLPKVSAITYEGVFYDHYFTSPTSQNCQSLFCPSYTTKSRTNLFTNQQEHFLSVGLDSNLDASSFKRKKLNIVVVLDISGSMSSPFNRYHYDNNRPDKEAQTDKMSIANNSLVGMLAHLKDEDRLGVVLFDNQAYVAKPLRLVKETNLEATKKHILDLKSRGGTNWSKGYKSGLALFDTLESSFKNPAIYENRIIFLTDAMPNRGELSEDGLFGMVSKASKRGIYTTFIGVGVDFNSDLVESVSKTRGANYFSVHSQKEFLKRMDKEFDYMVTPLVFDLKLKLLGNNKIEAVYGSPEANRATGDIMYVNTLFPSPTEEGKTKGGVILLKLQKAEDLILEVSYKDRDGKAYKSSQKVTFTNTNDKSIQKAILLSDYVTLMQNFTLDMRKDCNDIPANTIMPLAKKCMLYPPDRPEYNNLKTWERKSCPLKVSDGYQKLLSLFKREFKSKSSQFTDDSFKKEIEALNALSATTIKRSGLVDDWKSSR
jgi:Ca-activated chloride channel family protein